MTQLSVRELTEDEYPLWDHLVTISPQRSIFTQRWWMHIVTHGEVRLYGCFAGEEFVAGLPVWPCRTLGIRRLRQPPLTPYWGPLFIPRNDNAGARISSELAILAAFGKAMQAWPDIAMQCHPSLTNWLGFSWSGYAQTTRYTYRIEDWSHVSPFDVISHDSIKASLRRTQKYGLTVQDMVDPQLVTRLTQLSMGRQGLKSSEEIQRFWPALSAAALERKCMFTVSVTDGDEHVQAALATVWDERYAYGIFGGCDPRFRHTGGWTLCMVRELELARSVAPGYDFEGSMLETVEPFFRRFGGTLTPYFLITRASSLRLNMARALSERVASANHWLQQRYGDHKGGNAQDEQQESSTMPTSVSTV